MKDLYNLQRFAEDEETEAPEATLEQVEDKKAQEKGEEKAEAKYTDADLDRIIGRKFAEWQSKKEKEMDEAKRLASMSEQEKSQHEREQMQRQLEELLKEKRLSEMSRTARGILMERNINLDDKLLSVLVAEDADQTKANVDAFADLFNAAVKKAVGEALKGATPKVGTTSGGLTKEQIMKVQNRAERQRLIQENWDLFQN